MARAMTRPMRQMRKPRRILEVGPGTGAITAEIVRHLRPGDRFDIVEINADFVAYLGQRFRRRPTFAVGEGKRGSCTVRCRTCRANRLMIS